MAGYGNRWAVDGSRERFRVGQACRSLCSQLPDNLEWRLRSLPTADVEFLRASPDSVHQRWTSEKPECLKANRWRAVPVDRRESEYLDRMSKDGSNRVRVFPEPMGNIYATSPDRRWIVVGRLLPDSSARPLLAVRTDGGAARTICENSCHAASAPDGRSFYLEIAPSSRVSPGKTLVFPLRLGEMLPKLPAAGIRSLEEGMGVPGARVIEGWNFTPGLDGSVLASVKTTMHRNLFRIPLRSGS